MNIILNDDNKSIAIEKFQHSSGMRNLVERKQEKFKGYSSSNSKPIGNKLGHTITRVVLHIKLI